MEWSTYHLILIVVFVAIVIWVFASKRKARFEKYARIPLEKADD